MRFRAALSSLLAVVLLWSACAASACEVMCGVAASHNACHGMTEPSRQADQRQADQDSGHAANMPGMHHEAAAMHVPEVQRTSPTKVALHASAADSRAPRMQTRLRSCDRVCAQSAAAVADKVRYGRDPELTLSIEAAMAQSLPAASLRPACTAAAPPLRRLSPIRLHTTLRV